MNKSTSIANLASALNKFQGEAPKVKFDKVNPFIKNGYATLGAVLASAYPLMTKYGLSLSQFPCGFGGEVGVTSILMHETGEWLEESILVKPEVQKPLSINQAAGVTITYVRRYAAAAILGLVAEEDTDGDDGSNAEKAVGNLMKERKWTPAQTEAVSVISLETGNPMTAEDVVEILNFSALPENAPVKTIQSWFKRYLASDGKSVLEKSADANTAYIEAKKSGGAK